MRVRRIAGLALVVGAGIAGWWEARRLLRATVAPPDAAMVEEARHVRILRDNWGVPHVFGEKDKDAAFGLAYANSEDDWPTIQAVLAAARGRLSWLFLSKQALLNDYYAGLIGVQADVNQHWDALDPAYRDYVDAYAQGLDYYAALHPSEVDARLLPFTGHDIAAAFVHKLPILLGFTDALGHVNDKSPAVGEVAFTQRAESATGSNAQAVSRARSTDDVTRLNVNSHQPWEGPVTWYEAQIHSDEGLDMSGATFPGAPVILHGHNAHLGWAHTVDKPDLVDVYKLVTDKAHPGQYLYDGKWVDLQKSTFDIEIDTGWFVLPIPRTVYRSVQGPVIETSGGTYAIRFSSDGSGVFAGQQWLAMDKATSFDEWKQAMSALAIPMFNTVYADRDHIFYVYNARIPVRDPAFDYTKVLPGDDPRAMWTSMRPFSALPQVVDPASGFVQACNSTPYSATVGPENPLPSAFAATDGIETVVTNRAARTLELFGQQGPISRDDFLAMKWDRGYERDAAIFTKLVDPILEKYHPTDPYEQVAMDVLRTWDGTANPDSAAATIAILSWRPLAHDGAEVDETDDPQVGFQRAVKFLVDQFGTVNVPLGQVQRLRRGSVDLAIGGGPDVLNATYGKLRDGRLVGTQGDSYVMIVDFTENGPVSQAIHQYGSASTRPTSPHYADQAPLFVKHELRPVFRTEADIRAHLEREYHPGEELAPAR